MNKRIKIILWIVAASLLIIVAGGFIWLKYFRSVSADTPYAYGDQRFTHDNYYKKLLYCIPGPKYSYEYQGYEYNLGRFQVAGAYTPLGQASANVSVYKNLPVKYFFNINDYLGPRGFSAFSLSADFSSFQKANLTQTALPETFIAEIKKKDGSTVEENMGKLTYMPYAPSSAYAYKNVNISKNDWNQVNLYRLISGVNQTKELIESCDFSKTADPLISKAVSFTSNTSANYGLFSHVYSPVTGFKQTASVESQLAFSVPGDRDSIASYQIGIAESLRQNYTTWAISSQRGKISRDVQLPMTIYTKDNQKIDSTTNDGSAKRVRLDSVTKIDIYQPQTNSSNKTLLVSFNRNPIPGEFSPTPAPLKRNYIFNPSTAVDPKASLNNQLSQLANVTNLEKTYKTTPSRGELIANLSFPDALQKKFFLSEEFFNFSTLYQTAKITAGSDKTKITIELHSNVSSDSETPSSKFSLAFNEKFTTKIYKKDGSTILQDIGPVSAGYLYGAETVGVVPVVTGDITKIEIFIQSNDDPTKKDKIITFGATPEVIPAPISVDLSVSPTSGATSDLFSITAKVTDSSTETVSTNYNFWWNCNTPTASVELTTTICGQPRVNGDANYTQEQRDIGFKINDYFIVNNKNRRSTANEFIGRKYFSAGARTIKVIVERSGQSVEKRINLTVK